MKKIIFKNYQKYFPIFLITFLTSLTSPTFSLAADTDGDGIPDGAQDLGPITGLSGFQIHKLLDKPGEFLETVFTNLLGVFTVIAGLMFLIYFVLGAIGWITAEGDPEKVKKAQKQLTNAVAGLVLVVLAYSVAFVLGEILGLKILNPAEDIKKLGPNQ